MDKNKNICSLCGEVIDNPYDLEFPGNNPEPLKPFEERCCNDCNSTKVLPARMARIQERA